MAEEIPESTYVPETEEVARKERERRAIEEGLCKGRKEELQRQKQQEQRELQKIVESYSPWGKPGGGAPCAATLRKKNVPLEPLEPIKRQNFNQGWTSDTTIERLHRKSINPLAVTSMKKFFDDKSEPGISSLVHSIEDSKNRWNEEIQVYELTGGVELVPLLTSKRYYTEPQSTRYVATDATRPGYTIESRSSNGSPSFGIPEEENRNATVFPRQGRGPTNEICRKSVLFLVERARWRHRGGQEGLIARKYDKADGKRFVETLENLCEPLSGNGIAAARMKDEIANGTTRVLTLHRPGTTKCNPVKLESTVLLLRCR